MAYLQSVAAAYTVQAQRTLAELPSMPREWQDAFDMSQVALRLTPQEAAELGEELMEVVARYRRDGPDVAKTAPDGAERIVAIVQMLPEPGEPDEGADTP